VKTYRFLIFDIDDTLVDFRASQIAALEEVRLTWFTPAEPGAFSAAYREVNDALWSAFNRGEIDQTEIRRRRFTETAVRFGLPPPDWRGIGDAYEDALARHSVLYHGVLEALTALAPRYRLGAVTNGLASVQRPKARSTGLAGLLDPYVISEEEGVAKPAAEIFRRCLTRANAAAAETLMIGDSWESDGAGAANAGIDFCWARRNGAVRPAQLPPPVREIAAIPELVGWL